MSNDEIKRKKSKANCINLTNPWPSKEGKKNKKLKVQ